MAAYGQAVVDFGTGKDVASTVITGQTGILAGSSVSVSLMPVAQVNKTVDEQVVEPIRFTAGNIVAGTGFTIWGVSDIGKATGKFNVLWVWV